MRSKSPEMMERIKETVETYYRENHCMPTISELAGMVGLAKSSTQRYLIEMDEKGLLSYRGGRILADRLKGVEVRWKETPLLGGISCGFPVEEAYNIRDEYVTLPSGIFGDGDLYILRANGDSMEGAGISHGDYIVMKRQYSAKNGDIIAALVDHHESTLKRLLYDKERGCRYLHAENPDYEDMYFDDIEIQGVLVNVIKNGPF